MRGALLAVMAITLTACGGSAAPRTQTSSTPPSNAVATASPTPSTLFALVQTTTPAGQPDTVAIAGLDGRILASAKFKSRTVPVVPDGHVVIQSVAQVQGSNVYYIDGAETVRLLRMGTEPRIVASFTQQAVQVDTWFAVSPDGTHVLAGILTLPPVATIVPGTSWTTWDAQWDFKLMSVVAGSKPQDVGDASGGPPSEVSFETTHQLGNWWPTFPVGWTSAGPIAMYPVSLATKGAWPGGQLQVVHLDPGGLEEDQLGGDDCFAAGITSPGLIPCISSKGTVTVRNANGTPVWPAHIDSSNAQSMHLSPNGQAIADRTKVEMSSGAIVPMPGNFHIQGWLDDNTLVGRLTIDGANDGNLAWISLSNPAVVHDLGFEGDFVAPLT
jgi:hypothetical protein